MRMMLRNAIGDPSARRTARLGLLGALAWAGALSADDQPQWGRRFSRNMVSEETNLPEGFDPRTGRNIRWTVPLGSQTHGSPVVSGGKILIGTNNDRPGVRGRRPDAGVLLCLRQSTGELIWRLEVPKLRGEASVDYHRVGIASPPTIEGDRAWLVSNRGEVMCLDMKGLGDGNDGPYRREAEHMGPLRKGGRCEPTDADIVWLYDMVGELGVRQHDAACCSVLVHGRFVYACTANGVDHPHRRVPSPGAPSLIVLDKDTGKLVARDEGRIGPQIFHGMWSSASLGEVAGRPLVFFGGGDGVCYAYAALKGPPAGGAATLETAWSFHCDPDGRKDVPGKFMDNRRDSPSAVYGMPVFHEDRVYVTAGGDPWHGQRKGFLKCIDARSAGEITAAGEVWSYPVAQHCLSTPSVADGLVYFIDYAGQVHCVDAKTGRAVWVHPAGGPAWGSTLVADGKVYVGTRRRRFWVLAAGREKKVIACVDLPSAMSATPVAAGGVLYVASDTHLYAVERCGD